MTDKTIRLLIDLTYDAELMHGDDDDAIEWFNGLLLGDYLELGEFCDLGDMIGSVKVVAKEADRIEELQAERDEAWRRAAYAEEQWGRCEVKLAKAMELANLVVEFSDRALWKVAKNTVLELKGEK